MVHCIDNIMLTGPSEQEVATPLDLLVTHMGIKGQGKLKGSSTSGKVLGAQQ